MKILLLMPVDEQHTYAATAIYQDLPKEVQDITFSMPMYRQYLRSTKVTKYWEEANIDSFFSAEKLYKTLKDTDNFILIGNINASFPFDAVFNFQDIEESLPYSDTFTKKITGLVQPDNMIYSLINNLHDADESVLSRHNCAATADFLSSYLKTDTKLARKELDEKYASVLKKISNEDALYGEIGKNSTK